MNESASAPGAKGDSEPTPKEAPDYTSPEAKRLMGRISEDLYKEGELTVSLLKEIDESEYELDILRHYLNEDTRKRA